MDVEVGERGIRLGQLLKLANLVETGERLAGCSSRARSGSTARSRPVAAASSAFGDVIECGPERVTLR
jgi:hypothetical protein